MSRLKNSRLTITCIIVWSMAIFRLADGGSITWFEPPPFETVTEPPIIPTANINLTKGSANEKLSCNFSLSADLTLITVSIERGDSSIASFVENKQALSVQPGFENRFNVSWIPNKLTLTLLNVTSAEEGEYRCKVLSVGGSVQTWARTIKVSLLVKPNITEISANQTVIERCNLKLNCSAVGYPKPIITWTRLPNNNEVTMPFDSIRRQDAGKYRCTADNGIGNPATGDVWIVVQYKPDNVSLVANTTENINCADILWVNLTCKASDAVPPVERYQLLRNGETQATRNYGTWIRKISEAEHDVYGCRALHFLENVTADSVTITFNVPAQISVFARGSEVLIEGGNVSLYCNASGHPDPTVSWSKLNADGFTELNTWLNFTKIRRDEAGDYICAANNTCGKRNSSRRTIDVQYKPDHVFMNVSTNKVCAGTAVILMCAAGAANPAIRNYSLYEIVDGRLAYITSDHVGVFKQTLDKEGLYHYVCKASNSVGNTSSANKSVEVQVTGSLKIAKSKVVVLKGTTVSVLCNFSGFHSHHVSWINASNHTVEMGSILKFLNISRRYAGKYNCSASNVCGVDSKSVYIDVRYPAEATGKGQIYSLEKGSPVSVKCPVTGNPEPNITWYNGSTVPISFGKELESRESGCYTCVADNSLGTSINITQCLTISTGTSSTTTPTTIATSTTGSEKKEIAAKLTIVGAKYTKEFEDLNSVRSKTFVAEFVEEMDKTYKNFSEYNRTQVTDLRPGSVIVYFILHFSTTLTPEKGLGILQATISFNGTFGRYKAKDLFHFSEESTTSTTSGSLKPTVSAGLPWAVIGVVAGGVVLLAVIVGVLTWWVLKQRKCRKETKIHDSDLGRYDDEGGHSQVQEAYAQSGPPAANGPDGAAEQEIEVAGAIPTYSVVDMSKKSKKQAEENPPEYAVVDKSKKKEKQEAVVIPTYAAVAKSNKKKKSREELPPVYAEVDKSKKKKKKIDDKNLYETLDEPKKEKKPGELLYADLGDFQNPDMPTVCISPQPLPAIKKADPYERTDYADITQFLKGNATLPPNDGSGDTEMKPKRPSKKNIQGNDKETPI